MPTSNFVRWGAIGALAASLGWGAPGVLAFMPLGGRVGPGRPLLDHLGDTFHAVAGVGMLLWLVGSHVLQAPSYGRLGAVGFAASFFGTAVVSCFALAQTIAPATTSNPFYQAFLGLSMLVWLLGFTLSGMVVLMAEARVLPRWCGLLLIAFYPLLFVEASFIGVGGTMLGLLWLALGYALWSRRGKVARRPSRVA